jgi:hypothetical protein
MAFYQRQSPMCRFAGGARRGSALEASFCHRTNMCGGKKALLGVGDGVRLKVVEAETVDKPRVRVALDLASEAEAEKRHLRKLAKNFGGRFGNLADLSEPILSAICMVLAIIPVIERPASAKWKFPDKT